MLTPPVYHPFFTLVPEAGCAIWEVPLAGGRELDLDGIAAAFAAGARAMVLCNPHNPTGGVASRDELAELADLAAEHDAWILADEIHAPLTLAGAEHVPFLTVSDAAAERGFALVSASKAFNLAGLGCAQIVTAAERAARGRRRAARSPPPTAATSARSRPRPPTGTATSGSTPCSRSSTATGRCWPGCWPSCCPRPATSRRAAGYLAWIDLSAYGLGADPAAPILERGRVAFSSGPMFGSGGEGHVRLNAGTSPELRHRGGPADGGGDRCLARRAWSRSTAPWRRGGRRSGSCSATGPSSTPTPTSARTIPTATGRRPTSCSTRSSRSAPAP